MLVKEKTMAPSPLHTDIVYTHLYLHITLTHPDSSSPPYIIYQLRGAITKKKRENLGKIPKGGGRLKKQTKIPNFNLGILKTQGGGLDFSKMSEL